MVRLTCTTARGGSRSSLVVGEAVEVETDEGGRVMVEGLSLDCRRVGERFGRI